MCEQCTHTHTHTGAVLGVSASAHPRARIHSVDFKLNVDVNNDDDDGGSYMSAFESKIYHEYHTPNSLLFRNNLNELETIDDIT